MTVIKIIQNSIYFKALIRKLLQTISLFFGLQKFFFAKSYIVNEHSFQNKQTKNMFKEKI